MDSSSINSLKNRANVIKVASQEGENTAVRVGGLLYDMIQYDKKQSDAITKAENNIILIKEDINSIRDGGSNNTGVSGYLKTFFLNVQHGTTPATPSTNDYNGTSFVTNGLTWVSTNINPSGNQDTWMIQAWFIYANPVSIDGPIKIYNGGSGNSGSNGLDGEEIEWIYFLSENSQDYTSGGGERVAQALHLYNGSSKINGSVVFAGQTWSDHPSGISENKRYEYASYRTSTNDSKGNRIWGQVGFSTPILWSKWGEKGIDGDGVEYIFYANSNGSLPLGEANNPQLWGNTTAGKDGKSFLDNEFIAAGSSWMDDPIDLSTSGLGLGATEWVSMRKKIRGTWGSYSEPAVWARLAVDGGAPKTILKTESYFKAMRSLDTPSAGADTNPSGWHLGEDSSWGEDKPYLYCLERTIYTDDSSSWGSIYFKAMWVTGGTSGLDGADGYTVIVSPPYAIFEESIKRIGKDGEEITYNLNNLPSSIFDHYEINPIDLTSWNSKIQLLKDGVSLVIGVSDREGTVCPFVNDVVKNLRGDNGLIFNITRVTNDPTLGYYLRVEVEDLDATPPIGSKIRFWIRHNNSNYCLIEIPIYINKIGNRMLTILGDCEETIMNKTVYQPDPGNPNVVYTLENIAEYFRSSELNISSLYETVNNLPTNESTIAQTAEAINMTVTNGWYNYITNPLAEYGTLNPNAYDSYDENDSGYKLPIINDSLFGNVRRIRCSSGLDWQLYHTLSNNREGELTGKTVTWFCIVRKVSTNMTDLLYFGSGHESSTGRHSKAVKMTSGSNGIVVESGLTNPVNQTDYYDMDTLVSGSVKIQNGWTLCWTSVKLLNGVQINPGNATYRVGFNSMIGTWDIYYAGILLGRGIPSIEMILQGAGLKKAGINIGDGTVDIIANNTTFSYYDENGEEIPAHVYIDATTGTLHAENGVFNGTLEALNLYSLPVDILLYKEGSTRYADIEIGGDTAIKLQVNVNQNTDNDHKYLLQLDSLYVSTYITINNSNSYDGHIVLTLEDLSEMRGREITFLSYTGDISVYLKSSGIFYALNNTSNGISPYLSGNIILIYLNCPVRMICDGSDWYILYGKCNTHLIN